ncbi:MAG: type II toxin-antitoxin system HipA family toxin [Salinivirgaceae bacterium]|nr:type II toxin-antitoxin system HipA family toxin [Salinivirgaceae bacterium]
MIKPINKVEVFINEQHIGNLALTPNGLCAFEYTAQYLASGVSISPFYLPLRSGVFLAKHDPFNGLFGVFNDCLPDGWGKLLTDRILRKHKINLNEISTLHRLCLVNSNGVGALGFKPNWELVAKMDNTDLNQIAKEVEQIQQNNFDGDLEGLFNKGGSSGGARPKVFLKVDNVNWIIKFKSSIDPINIGEIEYQYSIAARKCGIDIPTTRLFNGKYFGVQRFDLVEKEKYHVHSASGLLYASFRYPSLDYIDLIKATLALTQSISEALKLYRQMVFNVLTFNKDDHAKNFSYILKNKTWQLSPAYDLVFSEGFNGQHTTTINGNGNPNKKDLFEVAKQTGLPKNQAVHIYDEVFENSKELLRLLLSYKLI